MMAVTKKKYGAKVSLTDIYMELTSGVSFEESGLPQSARAYWDKLVAEAAKWPKGNYYDVPYEFPEPGPDGHDEAFDKEALAAWKERMTGKSGVV